MASPMKPVPQHPNIGESAFGGKVLKPTPVESKINHPKHYTSHPSGVECITITEHMGFNLGNALKYIWRADLKNNAMEDLQKAKWYIDREIQKRSKALLDEV